MLARVNAENYPLENASLFSELYPDAAALNILMFDGKAAKVLYDQLEVEAFKSNTGVCEEFRGKKCSTVKIGLHYTCIISPKECHKDGKPNYACATQLLGDNGEALSLQCSKCNAN